MMHLTPTERRLLNILLDGEPHSREDLQRALLDEFSDNVRVHLHNLRRKLEPRGITIVCTVSKGYWYRLMKPVRDMQEIGT